MLAALIAVSVTLNVVILPFTQVADPIQKSFGIDDVKFSFLLGTFFALPTMIASIGGGWLADRLSRRKLLIIAIVLWTGGAMVTALATSYTQLAAGRLVVAAAAGIKFPLSMTWISDAYPPERRGKAVGALFVVFNIGPAIGASIGGVALQAADAGFFDAWPLVGGLEHWRAALVVLAASNLLVLPWVALLRDSRPAHARRTQEAAAQVPAQTRLFFVASLIAGAALLSFSDTANLAWLPTVLRREHGFGPQDVGLVFGLITTTAGLLGSVMGGWLGDWAYRRKGSAGRLQVCAVSALLAAPMLMAYVAGNVRLLVGALVISGVLSVLVMTLGYVVIQACLPPERAGIGTGVAHAMTNLAAAAAPTAAASASAYLATGLLGSGVAAVTVAALLAAAALYGVVAWRESRRQRLPEQPPDLESANAPA